MTKTESDKLNKVLAFLDDVCTRETSIGIEDCDDICSAREILAELLDYSYNSENFTAFGVDL